MQPDRRLVPFNRRYVASGVPLERQGSEVNYWDAVVFVSGWLIGLRIFREYDAHVHPRKRLIKFALLAVVFFAIH